MASAGHVVSPVPPLTAFLPKAKNFGGLGAGPHEPTTIKENHRALPSSPEGASDASENSCEDRYWTLGHQEDSSAATVVK